MQLPNLKMGVLGLLSVLSTAMLTTTPLAAQSTPTSEASGDDISSCCQALVEQLSLLGDDLDLEALGSEIGQGGNHEKTARDIFKGQDQAHIVRGVAVEDSLAEAVSEEPTVASDPDSIHSQIHRLLQVARNQQNNKAAAAETLNQATALTQDLVDRNRRDRWFYLIGSEFITLNRLEAAQEIVSLMTNETRSRYIESLQDPLGKALVTAYIQQSKISQAIAWIEAEPIELRERLWLAAIQALAQQGEPTAAIALFERIEATSSSRYSGRSAISRAYLEVEDFEGAQLFWQQQSLQEKLHSSEMRWELKQLSLWAGLAGELERAASIARQMPETYRAEALLVLAQLYHYQDQSDRAIALLAETEQLPVLNSLSPASQIALTYANLGQPDAAERVLNSAQQTPFTSAESPDMVAEWVFAYANIGAFDRAIELLNNAPADQQPAARFKLAAAYTDFGQYEQAITLLGQIPDQQLRASGGDINPKLVLFTRIINETSKQENFASAKRAAQVIEQPGDQALAWVNIASHYQSQQQSKAAIDALDTALAIANTIDQKGVWINRRTFYEVAKAKALIDIAKGYWTTEQPEKAASTLRTGLETVQSFGPKIRSGPTQLRLIANIARDWQQPDIHTAALVDLETQINPYTSAEEEAVPVLASPYQSITSIGTLTALAYDPNQPPSEIFSRNLTQFEKILDETNFEQTATPRQPLWILGYLASFYNQIDQPQQAHNFIERMLPQVEQLPVDNRQRHYRRLIAITAQSAELEREFQIQPRLESSPHSFEGLTWEIQSLAAADKNMPAIDAFEQLMQMSNSSLSAGDRDELLMDLWFEISNSFRLNHYPQRLPTSTEIALLQRFPQQVSTPLQQAHLWILIGPNVAKLRNGAI